MLIAQELRKKNITEYLLYMWQIEGIIRSYDCSISKIRREFIDQFQYTEEQKEEEEDWFSNLIRMMNQEGCRKTGHLQINKIIIQDLYELHQQLLASSRFPFYSAQYYRVLPMIVELRSKNKEVADRMARKNEENLKEIAANLGHNEIETCLDFLYGVMMLRLQKKEITQATSQAIKEITTLVGMLADYYKKDKEEGLVFDES